MTHADVLVVGAGPAGMAAAVRAAECGKRVAVLDDNRAEGGQIWRGGRLRPADAHAASWFRRFETSGAKLLAGYRVFDADADRRTLRAETDEAGFDIGYEKLILATGARELFLPFPGWTLPNVTGVGGMQALVKAGLPVKGKRIVVAGSGPLLLAVAAYLQKAGATVPAIVEQASWRQLARFTLSLAGSPGKLLQAARLQASLRGIPYWTGSWVTVAEGSDQTCPDQIRSVRLRRPSGIENLDCDFLAIAYGLTPNTELAALLGCRVREGLVDTDDLQRTSLPDIFCAGEATGIGGVDLSLGEGEVAGYAASGREDLAKKIFPAREKARRFAAALNRTFMPRAELRALPEPGTLVCRCEDVPFAKLQSTSSWRAAKLHSRCGMGPCQGRVCGPATEFLFGWPKESVRPPLYPARISALLSETPLKISGDSTT
jgi:NADPH-dependent 2,4-dienoyl-CoA reductase/sulfur reductase-like enzyme